MKYLLNIIRKFRCPMARVNINKDIKHFLFIADSQNTKKN